MIKINFYANEYVIAKALVDKKGMRQTPEQIVNISCYLHKCFGDNFKKLANKNEEELILKIFSEEEKEFYDGIINTLIFLKMKKETIHNLNRIQKRWQEKSNYINKFLKKLLKTEINIETNVYCVHPNSCRGYVLENSTNDIIWGHVNGIENPNYDLVYLTHETLHYVFLRNKKWSKEREDVVHTIIELIADNELYTELSGKSKYHIGHRYLSKIKKEIYPYWLSFLNLSEEKLTKHIIEDGIITSKEEYEKAKNIINDSSFKRMNIYEFVNFCLNNTKKFVKENDQEKEVRM